MSNGRRVMLWGMGGLACVALATLAAMMLLGTTPAQVWAEAGARTPHEVIRYLKRRLEGHPRLEAVLLPPLHAVQRRIEREPPPGPLPDLGKGQRPSALAVSPSGLVRVVRVDTPQSIRQALREATAGTRILVAPGLYPFDQNLTLGNDGLASAPIVFGPAEPGTVWLEFSQVNGIVIDRPHWTFENLNIRGACPAPGSCEHAFHVVGRGAFATLRNNDIRDFNAHIKVNGLRGDWPDHGVAAYNTLTNTTVRSVHAPVVPFDLVGASHWRVEDNLVTNFVHASARQTTYGIFMKGASEGGRIERNLVICSANGISRPGVRVGISFGGGRTGPAYCRDGSCAEYEHSDGIAANNIVAHCNDSGIDVNRSTRIALLHNTLINTSGMAARAPSTAVRAQGNLYEGRLVARDGSTIASSGNLAGQASRWFTDPDALDLSWREPPALTRPLADEPATDFHGARRDPQTRPGALR